MFCKSGGVNITGIQILKFFSKLVDLVPFATSSKSHYDSIKPAPDFLKVTPETAPDPDRESEFRDRE